jgi:hypothetical protein
MPGTKSGNNPSISVLEVFYTVKHFFYGAAFFSEAGFITTIRMLLNAASALHPGRAAHANRAFAAIVSSFIYVFRTPLVSSDQSLL